MLQLLRSQLHHSEAIDPTLMGWIRDEIDRLLGLDAIAIVALLGLVILAFPVWLGVSVARHRQHAESRGPGGRPPSRRFEAPE